MYLSKTMKEMKVTGLMIECILSYYNKIKNHHKKKKVLHAVCIVQSHISIYSPN